MKSLILVVHYLFYIGNPSSCVQRLWTKLYPPGASDRQGSTWLQQSANNTQQSLTKLCIGSTNLSNILVHIHVAKATWCRVWIVNNKVLVYLSTFKSGLLSQHCWDNHSLSITPHVPTLYRYSSCFNISPHFHWKCRFMYDKMGICNFTVFTITGIS